jgi:hypothetical protein
MVRDGRIAMVVEVLDAEVEATKFREKKNLFNDAVAGGNNKKPKKSLRLGQTTT